MEYPMNTVNNPLDMVTHIRYIREHFFQIAALPDPHMSQDDFPSAEMLARSEDGLPAGHVFDIAREWKLAPQADLIALEIAMKHHMGWGQPTSSFNLSAETLFDKGFVSSLVKLEGKNPQFNPRRMWLEITEQGGVPAHADTKCLAQLGKMGHRFALDDYNPKDPTETARLDVFGPFVKAVKFDHHYADMFRWGTVEEKQFVRKEIDMIQREFPHMIFVLEGVRGTDTQAIKEAKEANIHVIQESGYRDDGPVKPLDRHCIETALALG